jgi:purine-binding chemotaxis protein CheW
MMHEVAIAGRPRNDRPATISDNADLALRAVWLICRAGTQLCALPIEHVIEIMRGLPVEPVAGAPSYVRGLSVIRGAPAPVIDIGLLVGDLAIETARLVTIRLGTRIIALAVQSVLGISALEGEAFEQLPPLLRDAATEMVDAIGVRDDELLFLLRTARLVPEDVLAGLAAGGVAL